MQPLIIVAITMALLGVATVTGQQSCPLALTQFVTRTAAKGGLIQAAQNDAGTYNGVGTLPSVSLAKTTLPPCGVRQMHIHQNVDELIYVLEGKVDAYVVWPNSTVCENTNVAVDKSFVYPRNLVHGARNLDCSKNATYLAFFTAFDSALVNIGASAWVIPGSPFSQYVDIFNDKRPSIVAATDSTTLAYDADCLGVCNLGKKGGQDFTAVSKKRRA